MACANCSSPNSGCPGVCGCPCHSYERNRTAIKGQRGCRSFLHRVKMAVLVLKAR